VRRGRAVLLLIGIAATLALINWMRRSPAGAHPGGPHPAAPLIKAHVDMLAGTIGERNLWRLPALERAAAYIEETLRRDAYTTSRQTFDVQGKQVSNIEAVLAASSSDAEIVVVGAHYDSVIGCPGANDNATGVAAMLELARRFARRSHRRTIRFVAFVNEEPPFFQTAAMGSLVHANAAKARGDRIAGMLSLETMGYYSEAPGSQQYPASMKLLYPDVGNFIGFVSNVGSAPLLFRARRAFKARTPFPLQSASVPAAIPGVGWSDHWAFWQAGYRAMMVTDTAPYRYPWYHTAQDTPDKISADHLAHVVDGLEHVVEVLAGAR
jgi:Zn-dependent M28 family amino/carboxypeptidase